ncbi:MAG TPA: hypothetical protein VJ890_29020 [Vineibacter sp.]|nr:hypothetical protein [Vineibacter sp.]
MTQAVDFPSDPAVATYQPDYARQAEHLCRLGGEIADLAAAFEVGEDTIVDWLSAHPAFAQAVARGEATADGAVTAALLRRACGFELRTVRWFREDGKLVAKTFTREVPPDRQACMIWLRHRRPDLWGGNRRGQGLRARRSSDAPCDTKDRNAQQQSRNSSMPPLAVAREPMGYVLGARRSSDASCASDRLDARQQSRAPGERAWGQACKPAPDATPAHGARRAADISAAQDAVLQA